MRVAPDATDVKAYFNIGTVGLTIASMSLFYVRTGAAQVSLGAATALALATTAHTDNYAFGTGNGIYRVDFPDAAFAAGAAEVTLIVVDENTDVTTLAVTLDAALTAAQVAYVDSSLSAMKTVVDGIPTTPMRGTDSAVLASSLGAKGGLPILDAATGLVLTGFGAGAVKGNANVTEIGGDTQSATDLKDFADAGYDPSTNKVTEVAALTGFTQLIQRGEPPSISLLALEESVGGVAAAAGGLVAQLLPVNIGDLAIDVDGKVTANNMVAEPSDISLLALEETLQALKLAVDTNLAALADELGRS
jgi:hypothetical protein